MVYDVTCDTIPIVSERTKTVRCLSTAKDRVVKTGAENQIILANNETRFLLSKTVLRQR